VTPREVEELHDLVARIGRLTGCRVMLVTVPPTWSEDHAVRLSRAVGKVLRAGAGGLRAMERAVRG
jgi:hypothetical protein